MTQTRLSVVPHHTHTQAYPSRGSLSLYRVFDFLWAFYAHSFRSSFVRRVTVAILLRSFFFSSTSSRFMNERKRNHNRCVILLLFMRIFAGVFRFEFKCVIVLNAAAQKIGVSLLNV